MKRLFTLEEIVKVLVDNGFMAQGWRGGHLRLQCGERRVQLCRNIDYNRKYTAEVLRKAGVNPAVLLDKEG